jgi:hypothetical protein
MDERPLAEQVLKADPGLVDFFLGRLIVLAIRQAVTTSPDDRRTLGVAVFSTFLDCMDLGLTEEACKIVELARTELEPVEVTGIDNELAA